MSTSKEINRMERELDTRAAIQRPTHWRAPDLLPMPNERPGWKHRYIRLSMNGQDDARNISSRLREGYEPCKASDYPELMMHESTEGRFKGGIEVGGLLLCRIPEEFVSQMMKHYENETRKQMEGVDNSLMRQSDPRMPIFKESSSKVSSSSKE